MKCKICFSELIDAPLQVKEMMFGTGKYYFYYKCSHCGCLQIENAETNLENLYPPNYYSFNTYNVLGIIQKIKRMIIRHSVARSLGYKSLLNFLLASSVRDGGAHALKGKIKYNSNILDVGCGDGSLIDGLEYCGFKHLTGIDPYLEQNVIKNNYQLLKMKIEELQGQEVYDIIMLHHSFEHVEKPFVVVDHIKRLLKKDGLCIIRIPVCDSYAFDFYKENWVQLDAPRHFFLHTNKSMEIVTSKCNLRIKSIIDDSIEFQFIGSEQYKNGISLGDERSYYLSPYKKMLFTKKHLFSKSDIKKFKLESTILNKEGRGDQRIYYISN